MEQTSMNLGTVGQRLEAARQEKGVTVSEAGARTRILPKVIESMESDDFESLAAPVYVKGFLRLYAQYLGMDPVPLINEYTGQHAPAGRSSVDEVKVNLTDLAEPSDGTVQGWNKGSLGGSSIAAPGGSLPLRAMVGAVVLVLLLGVTIFSVKQCDTDDDQVPEPQAPAPAARTPLFQDVPNVYVVKPGVIELEQ